MLGVQNLSRSFNVSGLCAESKLICVPNPPNAESDSQGQASGSMLFTLRKAILSSARWSPISLLTSSFDLATSISPASGYYFQIFQSEASTDASTSSAYANAFTDHFTIKDTVNSTSSATKLTASKPMTATSPSTPRQNTPSTTAASTGYTPSPQSFSQDSSPQKSSVNKGAIAGGVVGSVAIVAPLITCFVCHRTRRRRKSKSRHTPLRPADDEANNTPPGYTETKASIQPSVLPYSTVLLDRSAQLATQTDKYGVQEHIQPVRDESQWLDQNKVDKGFRPQDALPSPVLMQDQTALSSTVAKDTGVLPNFRAVASGEVPLVSAPSEFNPHEWQHDCFFVTLAYLLKLNKEHKLQTDTQQTEAGQQDVNVENVAQLRQLLLKYDIATTGQFDRGVTEKEAISIIQRLKRFHLHHAWKSFGLEGSEVISSSISHPALQRLEQLLPDQWGLKAIGILYRRADGSGHSVVLQYASDQQGHQLLEYRDYQERDDGEDAWEEVSRDKLPKDWASVKHDGTKIVAAFGVFTKEDVDE